MKGWKRQRKHKNREKKYAGGITQRNRRIKRRQ
jgi:hypothetical protein